MKAIIFLVSAIVSYASYGNELVKLHVATGIIRCEELVNQTRCEFEIHAPTLAEVTLELAQGSSNVLSGQFQHGEELLDEYSFKGLGSILKLNIQGETRYVISNSIIAKDGQNFIDFNSVGAANIQDMKSLNSISWAGNNFKKGRVTYIPLIGVSADPVNLKLLVQNQIEGIKLQFSKK